MSEIRRMDFQNHPVVATELVKFLSINTSVEAVDKLVVDAKQIHEDMKELKKEVSLTAKNSSTNGNKVTAFDARLNSVVKRVDKLEK